MTRRDMHVPLLTEDEWDEFTDRLEEFEEPEEKRAVIQKHIEAIESE